MSTPSHPASQAQPAPTTQTDARQTRLVLCITETTQTKLPQLSGLPSCLLPAGHQTLLERLMSQCAALGIQSLDLLVSEDPHAVRKIIGQGERWGITVHWHWVTDGQHLMQHIHKLSSRWLTHSAGESTAQRLVIGQAHHWIRTALLRQMLDRDMVLIHEDIVQEHCADPWTGWMSLSPQTCVNWCETDPGPMDEHQAITRLATGQVAPLQIVSPQQLLRVASGRDLLALNQRVLEEPVIDQPVAWLHKPWGMVSPLAHVAAGAKLIGPVSIGPGCWVMDGAQVGPHVTLTRDVVVHANTAVSDTLVFEKTYVGSGLDIHQALVSANHMEHPMREVSFSLPVADGRLLPMGQEHHSSKRTRTPWLSRLLAAVLLMPLAPVVGLFALFARLRARPLPWTVLVCDDLQRPPMPAGPAHAAGSIQLRVVREPVVQPSTAQKILGCCNRTFAAWLDIAQGRRCWVGIRPHLALAQDHLPMDWQLALRQAPVGWLHAPAWEESAQTDRLWSEASADVFWIMQSHLSLGILRRMKNLLGFRPW